MTGPVPPHDAWPAGHPPAEWAPAPSEADRPPTARGGEFAAATAVMLALAAVGVLLGVLWQLVTPGAEIVMTGDGPVHADPSSESYFADDGWFGLIGGGTGVLAALGSWLLVRRHRGPVVLIGTVAGCLLSAVVAWQVGRHIGLAEFEQSLDHARQGETFLRPARLGALGVLGVQGFTAAFTYTLLSGWSRHPLLRPALPGELPYGTWPPPGPGQPAGPGWYAAPPGHPAPQYGHVPAPNPGSGSPGWSGGPAAGPGSGTPGGADGPAPDAASGSTGSAGGQADPGSSAPGRADGPGGWQAPYRPD